MLHIHAVAFGDEFLEAVADFLIRKQEGHSPRDFSQLGVVFSGRRPSLFLKKKLSEKIKGPFLPPVFFSWEEFIGYILSKDHSYSSFSPLEASFFIYKLAKSIEGSLVEGRGSFAQFFPWSRQILNFIDQLDLEDISKTNLSLLNKAAEIGFDIPPPLNSLLKNLFTLRKKMHDYLLSKKFYTRGLTYLLVSQLAKNVTLEEFDCLAICGLFYLHRSEIKILKEISRKKEVHLFFQNNNYSWQAFGNLERSLHIRIPSFSYNYQPKINIYAATNIHAQALILRQILSENKKPDKTVVVLLEPDNLIVFLSHIASFLKEFNVSLGFPIKRTPLVALIKSIFQAQLSRHNNLYYTKDYLNVLTHPYCKNIKLEDLDVTVSRILVHKIEEFLWPQEGVSNLFVSLEQIEENEKLKEEVIITLAGLGIKVSKSKLNKCLQQLHSFLFYNWEKINRPKELVVNLRYLLELLVEKGMVSLYGLHLKAAESLLGLGEEFERGAFSQERFSFPDLVKIFEDNLEDRLIAFSGSPLRGLQILGFFETRDLSFENVVFMGINEGVLPKLNIHQPLIPREVMLALGLERVKSEEEIQRYHFRRLLAGAKRAYLVFSENKEKTKSRFLEEIIWEKEKKERRLGVLEPFRMKTKVEIIINKEKIVKTPAILKYLRKEFVYSATSLDTYLHCPLRFYYAYVLRLKEKEAISADWEYSQVGNFIHSLLEKAFSPYRRRILKIDKRFQERFFRLFEEEFEKTFGRSGHSDDFILKEILLFRLKKFVEQEAERAGGEIIFLEEEFKSYFDYAGYSLPFVAKLDRVERLNTAHESLLIIDYKTGSTNILPAKRVEPEEVKERKSILAKIRSFQLPLYFRILKEEFPQADINAALYSLRDSHLDYLFPSDMPKADKEKIINTVFVPAAEVILKEIVDPHKHFEADKDDSTYCSHCPFTYMCG